MHAGNIHGQYSDLLRLFKYNGFPPQANYLFLGGYVDYGKQSIETICLLLAYKIKYPENFFLLRGNHECASVNSIYGFYDECKRRYNVRLWEVFNDCFNCLPVAALVDDKIFCVHGGLSPDFENLDQIRNLSRPIEVPESELLWDLLWSNPSSDVTGWGMSDIQGGSYTFGQDKVAEFLSKLDLDLICRGHQVVVDGYEFFADRQLVTLFSAPNFRGEFDNTRATMSVDETLMCLFQILKKKDDKSREDTSSLELPNFLASEPSEDHYSDALDEEDHTESLMQKLEVQKLELVNDSELSDDIINQLLECRSDGDVVVQLPESQILQLCSAAREVFLQQPSLLELKAPIKISVQLRNIHGQYSDLLRVFEYGGFPPQANYLFLGGYVDHGKQSIETICLLLAYKIKYPKNFFLLRGKHECANINSRYGFYDECKRRYNVSLWEVFIDCFNCLPVAALIDEKIFCVHGGLSPDLENLDQIRNLSRPTEVPDSGLLCDLLWSNPSSDVTGWGMSERGVSYTFGHDIVTEFLSKFNLDLIFRSQQVVEDGYRFFLDRQVVTVFSSPNFRGDTCNAGTIMGIEETLMISFQILKKKEDKSSKDTSSLEVSKPSKDHKSHVVHEEDHIETLAQKLEVQKLEHVNVSELEDDAKNLKEQPNTYQVDEDYNMLNEQHLYIQQQFYSTSISYEELRQATRNFDISKKIGEGGFAIVYKGFFRGTTVAIKTLRPERQIEQSGFDKEVLVLSRVRHPNLVTLIGFCLQPFILVYEYLPKGSLEDRLSLKHRSPPLSWQVRTRIIAEVRSALIFLHSNKPQPIVHGDLKPDNIFLDTNMVSKLGDFGICSFLDNSTTNSFCHWTDYPKGTIGYIDPEYMTTGKLTVQSDVYSFGVIILRLLTGRPAIGIGAEVQKAIGKGRLPSIIDPSAGKWPAAQAKELAKLALECCNLKKKKRPDLVGSAWKIVEDAPSSA